MSIVALNTRIQHSQQFKRPTEHANLVNEVGSLKLSESNCVRDLVKLISQLERS